MDGLESLASRANLLTRHLIPTAVAVVFILALHGHARADDPEHGTAHAENGCQGHASYVCVSVGTPGSQASSRGSNGDSSGKESDDVQPGRDDALGKMDCAIRKLEPQPPAGNPLWEGHKPGDGAVYINPCPFNGPVGTVTDDILGSAFWSAAPPPTVNPAVLAQEAMDKMKLTGPDIRSPRAGGTYTVGVPVWMELGQSPTTWGRNSASASAGGVTVTATAHVTKVVWAMGDGQTVICTGRGTPYRASYGMSTSPDCGHLFTHTSAQQPRHAYTVTATSTWTVDWQGAGQNGQLTTTRNSQVQIPVGEVQVVG